MYKTILVSARVHRVENDYGATGLATVHDYFCEPETLSKEIERACNQLGDSGYEVISIMPISRAVEHLYPNCGAGSSITGAAVVTGKKIQSDLNAPPRLV